VVVQDFIGGTGDPRLDALAPAIADSLRRALSARREFDVVDAGTTHRVGGTFRDATGLGRALGAGAVVSGTFLMRGGKPAMQLLVHDVASGRPLGGPLTQTMVPSDPLASVTSLLARTRVALRGVTWHPPGMLPPGGMSPPAPVPPAPATPPPR
jgi:hypothetical protein